MQIHRDRKYSDDQGTGGGQKIGCGELLFSGHRVYVWIMKKF
jgi:hypothetical protein